MFLSTNRLAPPTLQQTQAIVLDFDASTPQTIQHSL
jgi:hypothetical protein